MFSRKQKKDFTREDNLYQMNMMPNVVQSIIRRNVTSVKRQGPVKVCTRVFTTMQGKRTEQDFVPQFMRAELTFMLDNTDIKIIKQAQSGSLL